ncbi:hypothetical protein like AT1G74940 [Hibiscus trionum]|uniref:FLZ-type domain-containing protein n=1 Tax=Hibiscus trionum TaxID=183268 RepID=A0A9W7M953_HIBTR|nr:hypothetical protein like AT1G74940 [Hibiscus trionum]
MLGRRARPLIGNLPELLVSGQKSGFWDPLRSPRGPFDLKTPSPSGSKRFDVGGVGLGIIASMEESVLSPTAIVVNHGGNRGGFVGLEMDSLEDYTVVISHHGPGKSSTKVYFNGEQQRTERNNNNSGHDRNGLFGAVKETPSSPSSTAEGLVEDVVYPTLDFLSSCHLCKKKLHGKDIYMYRGEKGFCSPECRATQIMIDERKEQCKQEVSKSAKTSSLCYDNNSGQIFSTGILAI